MPGTTQYKIEWERKRRLDPEYRASRNAYQSAWKKQNREKLRAGDARRAAEWRALNPEASRAKSRRYGAEHPGVKRAACARRAAAKLQRSPAWADKVRVDAKYAVSARKTKRTGSLHEVDHVLPLQGKFVSGLHVHQNLRVVLRGPNRQKGAKYVP